MKSTLIYYILIVILLTSVGGNVNKVTTSLTLPSFYPPTYLFGLVWSILFILFGIFIYYAQESLQWIGLFYFTFVLLWTPLFVYTKSTAVGFYYLLLNVLSTIVLYYVSIHYSHPYSWILIPQFIWISFATIIAYSLYRLN
jgi:tryptophan-rich sensory protein